MKTLITLVLVISIFTTAGAQNITYTGTTPSYCAGGQIILTASNPPTPTGNFTWEKSANGSTGWAVVGANAPTLTVNSIGFYRVSISGPPVFMYAMLEVTETPNPISNFTYAPATQCGSVPITFTNSSSGATTYLWNFADINSGNNNTSTSTNPTHQFVGQAGGATQTFVVSLTAYNADGCENTSTNIVTINQLPDASLNGTGFSVSNGIYSFKKCANSGTDNFSFNNVSSTIASNTNYQIIWGDGSPDFIATTMPTSQILTHTFSQGLTNMLFIVTGSNGCKDTTNYSVFLGSNPAVGFGNPGNTAICSASTLTFPISSTSTNTIGTNYLVTFNDGTPPINFTHPPPASITHTFLYTSCGTYSPPSFPNSFSATILATNPCAQSLATVVPIYVSQKPVPSFSLSPNDTICLSNLLDVTNTSGLNSSNDNGSCTPGKVVWSITPATGWVLNSGSFGTLNGTLDPAFWTSGSQNLNFSFTAVGNYTIKMIIGNTFCGIDSITKIICVNPIPTADFNIDNTNGCTPVNVNTTNNANAAFCGNNTYNWQVNYAAASGCTANTANFIYLNGTTNTSTNPQFQFINPGTYTISLQSTSPGGTCTSGLINKVVTVKAKPIVSINFLPPICENQTVLPSATSGCFVTAASTYLWTFAGATPSTSTNAIPSNISYATAGNYNILLDVTNECGTTSATQPVVVNQQPNFIVPANVFICAGQSTSNYTFSSIPSGAIFSWTNNNTSIGLAAFGTGNIPAFVATNTTTIPQVATLNITASNGVCSKTKSFTITINPRPLLPIINSPVNYCQNNAALPLTAIAATGSTLLWYTTATGGMGTAIAPIPNTNTVGATIFYVSQTSTSTFNCESPRAAITVNVYPIPNVIGSSISPNSCTVNNGSITLSGLNNFTAYNVYYTFNATQVVTNATTSSTGTITISSLSAGTYTNIYVVLNNCTSNIVGPYTLTNPNPPATPLAVSNSPLCAGNTLQLNAYTSSPGAAAYSWTGPSGFASALQNPTIVNVSQANAGNYYVTVTINSCSSIPSVVALQVNPLPGLPTVVTPINYCIATPTTPLTANATLGNTLRWYNVANGGNILPNAPTPSSTTEGVTNYYVSQATAFSCEGARAPILVKINPNAKAIFAPTQIINCAPFSITPAIIGLQQFAANNNSYEWYANNILIGTGIIFPTFTINNQHDSVTIKLKTQSIFGCKADSMERKFYTFQVPVPSFTQSQTVGCGPLTINFANTTTFINSFNYNWNFGNGITSTLQQPSPITFATNPTYNDTTYIVKLTVSSICNAIIFNRTVTVKAKPKALFTPNITTGCSPMQVLFTNTSKGINNSYKWEFDDGTPTFNTSSITAFSHTFNTGIVHNYTIRLIATNNCGSDTTTRVITVAPNNIQLLYAINGPDRYGCAPHTVAFYNNSAGASSFQWNFGDGNTLATTQNVQTVYHTFLTDGNYTVTLTAANNCTDTLAIKQITVYPKPTAAFTTSTTTACVGQPILMNNTSSSGTSYLWDFGDGTSTSTIANPQHIYTIGSATPYTIKLIIYRVNPSGNVCTDTATRQVTVSNTLPGNFTLSATSGNCAPLTVNFANLITPSTSAIWNFGDGSTSTGDNVTHTYTQAGIFNVTLNVTAAGGCTYTKTTTVNLTGPTGIFNYTGGYTCFGTAITFAANATNTSSYIWNFGDGTTQTSTTNIITHNYANPGTYLPIVSLQNSGGCTIPLQGLAPIKIDLLTKGFTSSQLNNCGNTTVNFTDTSFAFFGKAQVKWLYGDGAIGTGLVTSHNYTLPGNYFVQMIVLGNSGCTDTTKKLITVLPNSIPVASIIGPIIGCAYDTILLNSNVISATQINPLQWKIIQTNTTIIGANLSYVFGTAGNYTVQLIATTINGCTDTTYHYITIKPSPTVAASNNANVCLGNSTSLNATGASTYIWSPTNGLSCSNCANPIATPATTTAYTVKGTSVNGCTGNGATTIMVIPPININVTPSAKICVGESVNLLANGANNYVWNNGSTLTNSTIANPIATPTVTTSYRVIGYDGFNCFADTAYILVQVGKIPTVTLGADATLATGTLFTLSTTSTNGPITQWVWTPTTNLSCTNCPAPIATIKKEITYTVKAITAFGCSATDAITIKTFCESAQVFIPNAFTPDGDGLNDILMVRGSGITMVKYFRIFNRWGELIFERNNFPPNDVKFGWDGKIRGVVGPPDVFVYTAEVICENGVSNIYKGNTSSIK